MICELIRIWLSVGLTAKGNSWIRPLGLLSGHSSFGFRADSLCLSMLPCSWCPGPISPGLPLPGLSGAPSCSFVTSPCQPVAHAPILGAFRAPFGGGPLPCLPSVVHPCCSQPAWGCVFATRPASPGCLASTGCTTTPGFLAPPACPEGSPARPDGCQGSSWSESPYCWQPLCPGRLPVHSDTLLKVSRDSKLGVMVEEA